MKSIVVKHLLYLLVVCSEARRIPRGLEYELFPNFRTVDHGHGATSYQNVDIENHGSVPIPTYSKHHVEHLTDYGDADHVHPLAIVGTQDHAVEHYIVSTAAPYYDDHAEHVTIEEVEIAPHHYQHYDHENYEYD